MRDFFKSYKARINRNHKVILEVANRVKDLGGDYYFVNPDRAIQSWVYIVVDGKKITFGFAEVPYRWYIGSEYRGAISVGTENPYTAEQIISRCKTHGEKI